MSIKQTFDKSDAQSWQKVTEVVRAALQSGDHQTASEAYEELRQLSWRWLGAIAAAKLPGVDAEDLVAEVYVDFLEVLQSGKVVSRTKALLGTIMRRRIVDLQRKRTADGTTTRELEFWEQYSRVADPVGTAQFAQVDEREARLGLCNRILERLPAPQREVLLVRYYEGLSVADTASKLDSTEDKIKKLSRVALDRAREIALQEGIRDVC